MKTLGLLTFHEWGDDTIDRPDNSEELMTACIADWWEHTGGKLHYFDERFESADPTFNPAPAFFYAGTREYVFKRYVQNPALNFPKLDYLLVRWRWFNGRPGDTYIMARQREVVEHYLNEDTKIVVWDEDYQFTGHTMPEWLHQKLHAGGLAGSRISAHRVRMRDSEKMPTGIPCTSTRHCPIDDSFLRDAPAANVKMPHLGFGDSKDPSMVMAYVGNNYNRDAALSKWIGGFSLNYPGRIHVYGNWLKREPVYLQGLVQHSKASKAEIEHIHRRAFFVPMIAKSIYFDEGHITPRLFEVLAGKSLPIGLGDFYGSEFYYGSEVYGSVSEFLDTWGPLAHRLTQKSMNTEFARLWNASYDKIVKTVLKNDVFSVERFLADAGIVND